MSRGTVTRPSARSLLLTTVITAGLGSIITATFGYLGDRQAKADDRRERQCELAASALKTDAFAPMIDGRVRQELATLASRRLRECLEQR